MLFKVFPKIVFVLVGVFAQILSVQPVFSAPEVLSPPPLVEEPDLSRSDIGNSGARAGLRGMTRQAQKLGITKAEMTVSNALATEDADKMNSTGLALALGLGVPNDPTGAERLFRAGRDRDHLLAQMNLAAMFYDGIGVAKDYSEALQLYLEVAETGNIAAMTVVGDMLRDGLGLTLDHAYSDSIRWFRRAAETRDLVGIHEYANMYFFGYGIGQDFTIARKWFEVAADRGYAPSQFKLGSMYEIGEGVDQNFELAAKYYRMAAESGMAEAQDSLGVLYMKGQGVARDVPAAARWFKLTVVIVIGTRSGLI